MTNRCSAAVPAAVRRASSPAAPMASRHRDSRQDAGATVRTIRGDKWQQSCRQITAILFLAES